MNKPKARRKDIVIQAFENETLLYDLKDNKAYCLNETSSIVWRLCNGDRTLVAIANEMSRTLDVPIYEDFIQLAIADLSKRNLIENSQSSPEKFDGVSRRNLIKKIGLASCVALPIIKSVVAPSAVNAQSCSGVVPAGISVFSPSTGTPTQVDCNNLCASNTSSTASQCLSCMGQLQQSIWVNGNCTCEVRCS